MSFPNVRIAAVAGLVLASACSYVLPRVRVGGNPSEVARLAGEWRGEYAGAAHGRSGSILFRLSANADSAFGDVVMVPRPQVGVVAPMVRVPEEAPRPASAPLTIRFVQVRGGEVSGTLDPYEDPDCRCTVVTTFRGTLSGDHVAGTFQTRGPGGVVEGTWTAERHH